MEIMKKSDDRNVQKTRRNVLIADDGESLNSKYKKGKISRTKYDNERVKNKRENNKSPKKCMWTRDKFDDLYHKQNLTAVRIGKMHVPPVSSDTIGRWIDEYGIEKKTLLAEDGESLKSKLIKSEISNSEYNNEMIKYKIKNNISPKMCMWTKEELEDLYYKQNLSKIQIGKMHKPSVSDVTIKKWLDIYGIKKKTSFEIQGGENNVNCHDGISFEPYCIEFTFKRKEYNRNYWHRRCLLCNMTEEENGQRLSVHHVDYNKNQGCDFTEWKLVPLCRSCNSYVNGDRNYYEYYFTNFIMIRESLEEFDYKIDWRSIGI